MALPAWQANRSKTFDERVVHAVKNFGGNVQLTAVDHKTGTDRIAEVAANLAIDIVVNLQGDEPLLNPAMIDEVIQPLVDDSALPILEEEALHDPNVVKVVFDQQGRGWVNKFYHAIIQQREKQPYATHFHYTASSSPSLPHSTSTIKLITLVYDESLTL